MCSFIEKILEYYHKKINDDDPLGHVVMNGFIDDADIMSSMNKAVDCNDFQAYFILQKIKKMTLEKRLELITYLPKVCKFNTQL